MKLDLSRKMLKHAIMTVPYNVTNVGISDKLTENFDKIYIDKDLLDKFERGDILIDLNQI